MRSLTLFGYFLLATSLLAADAESGSESESEDNQKYSQEQEGAQKKPVIKGITIADGLKLLVDNSHVDQWDERMVGVVLLRGFGISFACPALIPGTLPISMIGCGIVHSNGTKATEDPLCVAGLSLVSVPLLTGALLACYKPITWLQNSMAYRVNKYSQDYFNRNFAKGRDLQGEMDVRDIYYLAHILLAKDRMGCCGSMITHPQRAEIDRLLRSLSPAQALALAPFGLDRLEHLAEYKFAEEAQSVIDIFIKLITKTEDELSKALIHNKTIKKFKEEPFLWEALVRSLPYHVRNHIEVKNGLILALRAIHGFGKDVDCERIIDEVAQGKPLKTCMLQDITTELIDEDNNIVVTINNKTLTATKAKLQRVSTYFQAKFSSNWSCDQIEFEEQQEAMISIVFAAAHNQELEITEDSLWDMISAADFFGMPDLMTQCDRFMRDHGIGKKLLKNYWQQEREDDEEEKDDFDEKSFSLKWQFCERFSLDENKKKMLADVARRIDRISEKDFSALTDFSILNASDRISVLNSSDTKLLMKKLQDRNFFQVLWRFNEARLSPEIKQFAFVSLMSRLASVSLNDLSIIDDLNLLSAKEIKRAFNNFDMVQFKTKFNDKKFLPLFWKKLHESNGPMPLQDAVVEFCADANNKGVLQRAWFPNLPPELGSLVKSYQDN